MKKFIKEFGDFIKRGNVLDMAVGVIVGGAFTAIVTALSNGILKPFINWIIWLCNGKTKVRSKVFIRCFTELRARTEISISPIQFT